MRVCVSERACYVHESAHSGSFRGKRKEEEVFFIAFGLKVVQEQESAE